jgi:hypothetical protein
MDDYEKLRLEELWEFDSILSYIGYFNLNFLL